MTSKTEFGGHVKYQHELPEKAFYEKAWHLLNKYSGIPEADIEPHVRAVRDRAFAVFNYPCLGRWRFLDLYITTHPQYQELLDRTKAGATLLDAGCCVGQALRQLAFDGAPQENLAGTDLRPEFIDLGYELFRDRDTFKAKFVAGSVLDAEDEALKGLDGTVDIIHAASFFHLFGWDDQVTVGVRFAKFFKKGITNATVLGRQVGTDQPLDVEEHLRSGTGRQGRYHHNEASMQKLWNAIGERTGTKWKVQAELSYETDLLVEGGEVERTLIRYLVRSV
ncbi:hypothetical protein B0T25DRAFT_622633 [Lasiosphaeria hispida]|uniref:Methyltransferase type 12 domain-containing protein n=1 Tax=Lasiosphaeria hispida TaxID=260671 RepID=A0AAJ0HP34_9PEZI|nr:hypothetical protein B0T25DRAFT_622633 [Lasiosphaeria hispida]